MKPPLSFEIMIHETEFVQLPVKTVTVARHREVPMTSTAFVYC